MRLAVLCSGQAGQHRDMLDGLLFAPECRNINQAASAALGQDVGDWWKGLSEEEIFLNSNAQFAIAYFQMATWSCLFPMLPRPSLVAGYSLGELIACYISGALDAAGTFSLVQARARLMDEAMNVSGECMVLWRGLASPAMLARRDSMVSALGLSTAIVRKEGEMVLAGKPDAISEFYSAFKPANPNLVLLPVRIPSHTRHLARASESFRELLDASPISSPEIPMVGSVRGTPIRTRSELVEALAIQLSNTLRWDRCMDLIAESGMDAAIEIGPGSDLARLMQTAHPEVKSHAVEEFRNPAALAGWLKE